MVNGIANFLLALPDWFRGGGLAIFMTVGLTIAAILIVGLLAAKMKARRSSISSVGLRHEAKDNAPPIRACR